VNGVRMSHAVVLVLVCRQSILNHRVRVNDNLHDVGHPTHPTEVETLVRITSKPTWWPGAAPWAPDVDATRPRHLQPVSICLPPSHLHLP
jgi:hypothetical protein